MPAFVLTGQRPPEVRAGGPPGLKNLKRDRNRKLKMSQFFAFMSVINTRSLRARWAPSSMPAGHLDPRTHRTPDSPSTTMSAT